jgi:hypothetical protein
MVVAGALADFGGGGLVLGGVFTLLLGPLMVRIWCEVLIVVFRILDTLVEIRDKLRG